jgi:hypothetical protein
MGWFSNVLKNWRENPSKLSNINWDGLVRGFLGLNAGNISNATEVAEKISEFLENKFVKGFLELILKDKAETFYKIFDKIVEAQIKLATLIVNGEINKTEAGEELDKLFDKLGVDVPDRVRLIYHVIAGKITDLVAKYIKKDA